MNKSTIAIVILVYFLSACSPIQPAASQVNTNNPVTTLVSTGTPTVPVSTPTITSTPYEIIIRMSPTMDAWDRRVEIPFDKKYWIIIDVPEESKNAVDYFNKIAIDSKGIGWVSTDDGLFKVVGKKLKTITYLQIFGIEPTDPTINTIGSNNRSSNYDLPIGTYLYGTSINDLIVDQDDRVWISFDGPISDLIVIGNDEIGWTPYKMDGPVSNLAEDRNGNVWLTYLTEKGDFRVVRHMGDSFEKSISVPTDSQITQIFSMAFDGDNLLWLDTDVGIIRLSNGEWEEIPAAGDAKNENHCYGESMSTKHKLLASPTGDIWGIRGVCMIAWQGSGWKIIHAIPNDPSDLVSIVFDQDDRIWTGNGYLFNGINYIFTSKNLFQVNDIAIGPDNSIWYASAHFLSIYDNKGSK